MRLAAHNDVTNPHSSPALLTVSSDTVQFMHRNGGLSAQRCSMEELAGGAVCNSDCDGTVWLRVAKEGRADRGSFQKMSAVANEWLVSCPRPTLEASAPAAFAPAPALSGPACLAHWLQRPSHPIAL